MSSNSSSDPDDAAGREPAQSIPNVSQSFRIHSYDPAEAEAWDDLVARSCNGTFLHTRRYLGYHGSRFVDRSLVIEDGRGKVSGVFPAAESSATVVSSHPGLTYGGLVHDGSIRGDRMATVMQLLADELKGHGYRELLYKTVPRIYHQYPAEDDLYTLSRMGGQLECDLSAAFRLDRRNRVNHGRKYHRKLAVQAGIVAQIGWDRIEEFWAMLTQGLKERHQTAPVHSLQEINVLHERFPQEILLCTASADGEALAGTLLYCAGPVVHTQYTAASNAGRLTSALDPVIEYSVEYASTHGYTYFDFGISNDGHGRALNASLQDFKVSFGAGGVVYVQVSLPLD